MKDFESHGVFTSGSCKICTFLKKSVTPGGFDFPVVLVRVFKIARFWNILPRGSDTKV